MASMGTAGVGMGMNMTMGLNNFRAPGSSGFSHDMSNYMTSRTLLTEPTPSQMQTAVKGWTSSD
jgi:hypothetical protein